MMMITMMTAMMITAQQVPVTSCYKGNYM